MHYLINNGKFRSYCIYVDNVDDGNYKADALFRQRNIRVRYKKEFMNDEDNYHIMICTIKKKDVHKFTEALDELVNKMLICGHADYPEYCNELMCHLNNIDIDRQQ